MNQCMTYDITNKVYHSGIILFDGSVICGCCGGLLPAGERDKTWKIIKEYKTWTGLDEDICGDDLAEARKNVEVH